MLKAFSIFGYSKTYIKQYTMSTKAGYVTIIGRPNVGKSTLMNALLKEKLSIVTHKPQTTRKRILGIYNEEDVQIIFYDTPGILEPHYLLQSKMMDHVYSSVNDADILILMIDIEEEPLGEITFANESILKMIKNFEGKKILVANKVDLSDKEKIDSLIEKFEQSGDFEKIIPVSAKLNFNIDSVLLLVKEFLPEHPKYFPDDQITDESERFYVTEIIREKALQLYQDEIPYSIEVVIEDFKERENAKDYILANIIVERDSQKVILIGKLGEAIKKLSQTARFDVEQFLQRDVYLELKVKVKENWRKDPRQLRNFGYNLE